MSLTGNDILAAVDQTIEVVTQDPSQNALLVLNEIVDGLEANFLSF